MLVAAYVQSLVSAVGKAPDPKVSQIELDLAHAMTAHAASHDLQGASSEPSACQLEFVRLTAHLIWQIESALENERLSYVDGRPLQLRRRIIRDAFAVVFADQGTMPAPPGAKWGRGAIHAAEVARNAFSLDEKVFEDVLPRRASRLVNPATLTGIDSWCLYVWHAECLRKGARLYGCYPAPSLEETADDAPSTKGGIPLICARQALTKINNTIGASYNLCRDRALATLTIVEREFVVGSLLAPVPHSRIFSDVQSNP